MVQQRFPGRNWERMAPEALGIRPEALLDMLRRIHRRGADLHSLLAVRHGALAFEYYAPGYGPDMAHQMYSVSKTFCSMAVGEAEARGLLSLEDPVLRYFPEADPGPADGPLRRMKIRHLLTMSTGHLTDPYLTKDGWRPDRAARFFEIPVLREPGSEFRYETGASFLLGAIVTRVTGLSLLDAAKAWFLDPIGVTSCRWQVSPEGYSAGGTNMCLTAEDMARFGLLLLRGGLWNGERLLPGDYLRAASSWQIHSVTPGVPEYKLEARQGYGYQTWMCSFGAWRADGACGQLIVMIPGLDLVVTADCAMDNREANLLVDALREGLLPGVLPEVIPADPRGSAALSAYLARRADPAMPEEAVLPLGAWRFDPAASPLGLRRLALTEDSVELDWGWISGVFPWGWNVPVPTGRTVSTLGGWCRVPAAISMRWEGRPVLRVHAVSDGRTEELRLPGPGHPGFFLKSSVYGEYSLSPL